MCGRFAQRTPARKLARQFKVEEVPPLVERYNIAPAQDVLAVRETTGFREAALLKWGLVPYWAKDPSIGAKLINARCETVTEKPSFREAFRRRRCLIPADGFYEWKRTGGRKQPYFFQVGGGESFAFAGLWDRWQSSDGEVIESCAVLTTQANEVLRPVHDRMPVIIHPKEYDAWLGGVEGQDLLKELLRPFPASEMVSYMVSERVNSPHRQGAELTQPLI